MDIPDYQENFFHIANYRSRIAEELCSNPEILKVIRSLYSSIGDGTIPPRTILERALSNKNHRTKEKVKEYCSQVADLITKLLDKQQELKENPNPEIEEICKALKHRLINILRQGRLRPKDIMLKTFFGQHSASLRNNFERLERTKRAALDENDDFILHKIKGYKGLLEREDLVQIGRIALNNAIEKYEYSNGWSFGTYAGATIDYTIQQAIEYNKIIRLKQPTAGQKLDLLASIKRRVYQQTGQKPSLMDLVEELKCLRPGLKDGSQEIWNLLTANTRPLSLNTDIGFNDERIIVGDLITGKGTENPFDIVKAENFSSAIWAALNSLDSRAKEIICSSYGLNGKQIQTQREMSEPLQCSIEEVRSIRNIALRKLKRKLQKFLKIGLHFP